MFEQRYLVMLSTLLQSENAEFGVVLIERGQEVGGGEQRFGIGTVAEITTLGTQDGFIGLLAEGRTRIRIDAWLDDDPHPRAEVSPVPDLVWDEQWRGLLATAERSVRRSLAVSSEFSELTWPADIGIEGDPVAAAWQLAGVAPIGPLDQVGLLASTIDRRAPGRVDRAVRRHLVGSQRALAGRGLSRPVGEPASPRTPVGEEAGTPVLSRTTSSMGSSTWRGSRSASSSSSPTSRPFSRIG